MASSRDRPTTTSRIIGSSAGIGLPAFSRARLYTSICRAVVATVLCGLMNQASVSRAARSIARSALAPTQTGGVGFWTGLTVQAASMSSKCEPFIVTRSSVHNRRIASRLSTKRGTASFCVVPNALNSTSR